MLWCAALALEVAGPYVRGVTGWRLHPGHFAERHGLIIIIALGESIVAVGVGVAGQALTARRSPAVLGVAVAAALWWAYFDVVALVAERRLAARAGRRAARIARDSWTFLHLPMVAGIVLFALGMKKTLAHVDEPLAHRARRRAVRRAGAVPARRTSRFRLRNVGTLNKQRQVTAIVLAALIPVAHALDALPALAVVTVTCCGLIAYEALRFREARDRVRHANEVMVSS